MKDFGATIRELREAKKLPLRVVSAYLDIDQAILSKIERGQRKAAKELAFKLAVYFQVNKDDLMLAWLSDKILYEVGDEELAPEALQLAKEKLNYIAFRKIDRNKIKNLIISALSNFNSIHAAWIYGSFSRGDDGPKSDIDIAIRLDEKFSYFDLAEVQFQLENLTKRKVDIGFLDSFKPYILEHIQPDLKLIYERPTS
ncbi:MAG: nucleotidyltransferase domain-containing protein [Prolixibacteraceae bacterium]|nr:nucleotidyltransferase domain-containing protein [Prolixibacteraceae bacterium]